MAVATLPSVEYFARASARLSDTDATIIGQEIVRMGKPTPKQIVEAARPDNSPLHRFFTWDNAGAAESWRIEEARILVRSISVRIINRDGEEVPVRAFHLLPSEDVPNEQRYTHINVIRDDPDKTDVLLHRSHNELVKWFREYGTYRDVLVGRDSRWETVFTAIEKIVS